MRGSKEERIRRLESEKSPRLNFPVGTLFNWVKRAEV